MKAILLAVFLVYASNLVFAEEYEWMNYTNLQSTRALVHDKEYLWVGTDGGLVKFNKKTEEKVVYTKVNSELPNNQVTTLALDKKGALIVGMKGPTVAKLENDHWSIYDISPLITLQGVEEFNINDIQVDKNNTIWVNIPGQGLLKNSGNTWELLTPENSGITQSYIQCLGVDSTNTLWIGTRDSGIVQYKDSQWINYTGKNVEGLPDAGINAITVDINNKVWFSTSWGNLVEFKNNTWKFNYLPPLCGSSYIANKISVNKEGVVFIASPISGVAHFDGKEWAYVFSNPGESKDSRVETANVDPITDILWFGIAEKTNKVAYRGILKYDGIDFKNYNFSSEGLSSNSVNKVLHAKDNIVWVATGAGLAKYDGAKWSVINQSELKYLTLVTNMEQGKDGTIWLHGIGGIGKYDGKSFTISPLPFDNEISYGMSADSSGNILFSTSRYGLLQYDGSTWKVMDTTNSPIPSNMINSIATDRNGIIWIGTDKGLAKLEKGIWTIYKPTGYGITENYVAHIAFDTSNVVWYNAGWKGGLVKFDGTSWTQYLKSNSQLPENSITTILIDKKNRKWIGTQYSGLVLFKENDTEIFNSVKSGLIENQVTTLTMDRQNAIWIGSNAGISVLKIHEETGVTNMEDFPDAALQQNIPNPASEITTINYTIANDKAQVEFGIYDVLGRKMETLVNNIQNRGEYTVETNVHLYLPGIYFYQLNVNGKTATKKMIVIRN